MGRAGEETHCAVWDRHANVGCGPLPGPFSEPTFISPKKKKGEIKILRIT